MAPFSFIFIALALASHGVFGAPSCSTDLSSCASKCKAKWHHHHTMVSHAPSSSPAPVETTSSGYPKESPVADVKITSGTSTSGLTSSPVTQPSSTPSASSSSNPASPSASSGSVSSSDIDAYLNAHNDFRKLHGANPLTWSDTLSSTALAWAKGCKFEHSQGQYGENLAAATGALAIADAVKMWTDEAKDYDPTNPEPSHFTQVVWKATTQVGCAEVTCGSGTIFSSSYGPSSYVVCEYNPPGNFLGEFPQNVQA